MRRSRTSQAYRLGVITLVILVTCLSTGAFAQTVEPTPSSSPTADASATPAADPSATPSADATAPAVSLIVKLVSGLSSSEQQDVIARDGGSEVDSIPALRLHVVEVAASDADQTFANYQADAQVQRVEKDRTRESQAAPSDPAYGSQWGLPAIGWDSVYGTVTPSGTARVAVLDTGVDATTPDLSGRMVAGFSAFAGESATSDPNGHGTRLASIVAAAAGNDEGIAGVGYDGVQIQPVKVLDHNGLGQDSDIIEGLVWAADHGADVVLMAFSSASFSADLQDAVDYAWSKGAVIVASTGNDGSTTVTYPAGDAKVVGVSATDSTDALWSGSNHGADTFLAAPGVDITVDDPGSGTSSINGTSASAAFVAGAAALMRAADQGASNAVIVGRLARNADTAGTQDETGNGRLNLARAIADTDTTAVVPAGAGSSGGPFVGPYVADAGLKIDLQGQSCTSPCTGTGTGTWTSGGLANWRELDSIPTRLHFTSATATGQALRVDFDHTKSGSFVGIQNLTNFLAGPGVSITSAPVLSAPAGSDIWSYSFTVDVTAVPSDLTFTTTLGAGAHLFTGASMNLGGNPSSMGNLQIAKPAAKAGNPDLSLTKSGPGTAQPGQTITYTLNYSNKSGGTITSATGVQVRDVLPSQVTYVAGSATCTGTCTSVGLVGNTLTWNMGTLAPGASGSMTYQVTVNSGLAFGSTFANSATINEAENDATPSDNGPRVVTTTVSFNRAPVATNDSYSTNEDTPLTVVSPGVLSNDSDLDGNALTAALVSGPAHGSLTLNANGSFTYTPAANYNGPDSFTYKANDGSLDSNTATVSITVNPINDAPVAANDSYTTAEDTQLTVAAAGVLSNDSDIDSASITSVLNVGPLHGSLVLNTDGSFTYTPAANYNGPDSFTYHANDGSANSNVATVSITVTPVNDAPVAADDAYSTSEDNARTVPAPGVLANDTDAEGSALTAALVAGPSHGTLTLNANGSFTYTPAANYNGSDTFTYKANDGSLDSNVATVTITITPVNDAPVAANDSYSTNEDTALTVAVPGVLGNDSDVDSASLTAVLVSGSAHGSLTLNANGSFTYTPAVDYNGPDSFTYKANDGSLDSNTATVSINVVAVDDAPACSNQSGSTNEDVALSASVICSDVDGPALTYATDSTTSHGSLTFSADGTFTYTPNADYNGSDSFTFHASDGTKSSNVATYTITVNAVNDAPVAANDSYSTNEDTALTVAVPGVLGNDSDVDSASLTAVLVSGPAHGSLTLNANGSFTYTPSANYNGPDSFTYKANDGSLNSNVATASITVDAVNDPPVCTDQSGTTDEDVALSGSVSCSDIDSASLTYAKNASPAHGSLTFNADGTFTYTPDANYNGSDTFTFHASDGSLSSNVATYTITITPVNDAPVAADDSYTTDEDIALVVSAPGVLGNDTDVDSSITAVKVSGPAHGSLTLNANGSFTYTPSANYSGPDSFTYKANDGSLDSNVATVSITVNPVNDPPVAVDDHATTDEDTAVAVDAIANDTDVDGDALVVTNLTQPAHGTTALITTGADAGKVLYTPDANYNGSDSFTYTANDGTADSDSAATVTLTVNPVNDAPTAAADSYATNEDTTLTKTAALGVRANDSDVETATSALTVTLGDDVAHGSLTLNANGSFSYVPAANYNGPDSFTYTVTDSGDPAGCSAAPCDGPKTSAPATVHLTVNPVNDAPTATSDSYSTNEDTTLTKTAALGVRANDSDVETATSALTVTLVDDVAHGTLTLNADGSFSYVPSSNYNGGDSFTYTVTDSGDPAGCSTAPCDAPKTSAPATAAITVNPVNDAPTAAADSYSTNEDTTLTKTAALGVRANDSDVETATGALTVALTTGPSHGSLTLNSDGSFSYTPSSNYNGSDSFTYTVTDSGDPAGCSASPCDAPKTSAPATVTLMVNPINDAPTAANDSYSTNEDTTLTKSAALGVRANDSDVETATGGLTVALTTGPSHGSLTLNADGSFSYTPAANYNGPDSFTYTVTDSGDPAGCSTAPCDGAKTSAPATVTLTVNPVNDVPTAAADSYATNEDSTLSKTAALGVRVNDSDVETATGALTVAQATGPAHGTLTLNSDGSFSYTPAANYNGSDSFTYTVTDTGDPAGCSTAPCDGAKTSAPATVTLTVNPVNDAPTAAADSYSTNEDTTLTTTTSNGVRANDSDVETPLAGLTVHLVDTTAHGALTLNADGSFSYTPAADYNGPDSFTYTVTDTGDPAGCSALPCDAEKTSSPKTTVSITVIPVNDAPRNLSATPSPQYVQYSDPIANVTVSATDIDSPASALTASMKWKKSTDAAFASTQPLGGLTLTPSATPCASFPCTWTLSGRAMVGEGTYIVRVYVSDGQDAGYVDVTIYVGKEDASIEYTGDVFKNTSSPNTNTASMSLSATIREAGVPGGPTGPGPEPANSIGDTLAGKFLQFTVFNFNGSQAGSPCTVAITRTGLGTGLASCTVTLSAGDPYSVNVALVTNDFYTAPEETQAVTVSLPGTGFVTGGGWVTEPTLGTKSNFGFTVKRQKNGNLQGNSLYIYRKTLSAPTTINGVLLPAGDYNWKIKSNSWSGGGLNQACTTTSPIKCTATFSGKNNIAAINRATGVEYSLGGNYNFQVDVDDYAEPGSSPGAGPDGYAIRVWDTQTGTYYQLGQPRTWSSDPFTVNQYYGQRLPINGGNIQVH